MTLDPASDAAIFFLDLQDVNKKQKYFCLLHLKVNLHHCYKIKSHKEVTKK
jgi:hypothetical protein